MLYDVSVAKKITWTGEYAIPFIGLGSEVISTATTHDMLDAVARDMPAFMMRNIVLSDINNVGSVEVLVGDLSIVTEVISPSATTHAIDIFSGGAGIIIGSIGSSDIRLRFTSRDDAQESSTNINTIETYVLMSKIISSEYTHQKILHEVPLIYKYDIFTFLFDKNNIAIYNEEVDLGSWSKVMQVEEFPYHTTSDEYKSVEMDISNPAQVLEGLPGFDEEETNVKTDALTKSGVYRVPIKAADAAYAEKYLSTHPNVVKFEIKELAFVSPDQRDKNIKHSNKLTLQLYRWLQLLLNDGTEDQVSALDTTSEGFDDDGDDGGDTIDTSTTTTNGKLEA